MFMSGAPVIMLQQWTGRALRLEGTFGGEPVSPATGFVARWGKRLVLVTNRHVVRARNNFTNANTAKSGAWPDEITVWHHDANAQAGGLAWVSTFLPIRNPDGSPTWWRHPNPLVDIVAIPFNPHPRVRIDPVDVDKPGVDVDLHVAKDVFAIGFPFGIASGVNLPIWTRATIAAEPGTTLSIDGHDNLPGLLIDARTRPGQSGSPVVWHSADGLVSGGGGISFHDGPTSRLVGIYSGRISDESDLGIVWPLEQLVELLKAEQVEEHDHGVASWPELRSAREIDEVVPDAG